MENFTKSNQKIIINSRDKGYKVIMTILYKVTTAGILLFLNGLLYFN